MPVVALLAILLQTATSPSGDGAAPPPSTTTRATAVRAKTPVVIDGRDVDEVWRVAPAITQFREFQPKEDGDPRFATEAKVAYDDRNLYVFIRAFDPHPDSILKVLARRDVRAATDQLKIMIDSYHDRRNGFEFAVNPAGVKRDYAIYNDNQEDDAWDAVWDVATQVDSLGWTAEFRIPLSQLRYVPRGTNTFGFGIWRDIQRYTERESWPLYRNSQSGISSQLGELTGLVGLPSPRRPEIAPYMLTKNVSVPTGSAFDRSQKVTGGADLKYGITSNLTLDATVNPDFGQVEADPSVLNLTAFETFLQERRPFFVQGAGIFTFKVNCSHDPQTENVLRRSAYVGAVDFRHRFLQGHYQIAGSVDLSRVAGTESAIALTQQDPVHFYQRTGNLDATRTSLSGNAEELLFGKVGGGITRFETSYLRRSQGFEANDQGFLLKADKRRW